MNDKLYDDRSPVTVSTLYGLSIVGEDGVRRRATGEEIEENILVPPLEMANEIRLALAIGEGKLEELPQGVRSEGDQCVLAKALSNGWQATVGYDTITLKHADDGTVDFNKSVATLEQLGYRSVTQNQAEYYGQGPQRVIQFDTPIFIYTGFLTAFDEGQLPDLILNDD